MKTSLKIVLLSLIAFTGLGCYSEAWYVDERFTEYELVEIRKAAKVWEDVGHPFDLIEGQRVDGKSDTRKEIVKSTSHHAAEFESILDDKTASASGRRHLIVIVPERMHNLISDPYWVVVAHEMGHSLMGPDHVQDPRALMAGGSDGAAAGCLTKADIRHMCSTLGCPGETPKGCDEL